jgi:cytochrome P450
MDYNQQEGIHNELAAPNGTREYLFEEIKDHSKKGLLHVLYNKYLEALGESSNIILPYYNEYIIDKKDIIIINNAEDAERIAENHIKKTPYLKPFVYESIISTTNTEHWNIQRRFYQQAFSVSNELKKIIPISNARAKLSMNILRDLPRNCDGEYIDIHEFFLNETMAQLMLAMFGFSNEFQEETNRKIRKAFLKNDTFYAKKFVSSFFKELTKSVGPLSNYMKERNKFHQNEKELIGNSLIFPFAGHDTTANTLSWLIFEICKNNNIYTKLQKEVDIFWDTHDENNIKYEDLKQLKYMTRCIHETLRLWTSIPNGTSRELICDDYIIGKNKQQVKLPKGTYVQIPNWTRHRNPELWGIDVLVFNPDRDFEDEEIYGNFGLAGYNPNTSRFSPFTFGPRDCIGKNFTQIEMRLILIHLLKNFKFTLPKSQLEKYNQDTISFNAATLSPRNIFNTNLYEKKYGMYVNVITREKSKL